MSAMSVPSQPVIERQRKAVPWRAVNGRLGCIAPYLSTSTSSRREFSTKASAQFGVGLSVSAHINS
jgi:hypothetical protein